MSDNEKWLPIKDFEESYEVSDMGRIRSLDRVIITRRGAEKPIKGRLMVKNLQNHKYHRISLGRKGTPTPFRVDTLVYTTFVGKIPPGKQLKHLDGNKGNDKLANLGLVEIEMVSDGFHRSKNTNGRISDQQIREMRALSEQEGLSQGEIARKYRISKKSAALIVNRMSYRWVS